MEAISYESKNLERSIYQIDIKKAPEKVRVQIELFNQILTSINNHGLSELHPDVSKGSD